MAHVRRTFFDVYEASKSPLARAAMDKIATLIRDLQLRASPAVFISRPRIGRDHVTDLLLYKTCALIDR